MNQSAQSIRRLHEAKRRWWSCAGDVGGACFAACAAAAFPTTFDPDWWLAWGSTYPAPLNPPADSMAPDGPPTRPVTFGPSSSVNGAVTRERKSLGSWAAHDSVKSCIVRESRGKVSQRGGEKNAGKRPVCSWLCILTGTREAVVNTLTRSED